MAGLYDYNTNADLNTTVGGVFIGELCPAANLNNGERAIMADIASAVAAGVLTAATASEIWTAASSAHQYNTMNVKAMLAPTVITDSAAITLDLSTGVVFTLTKASSGTMAFTNAVPGYTYEIFVTQDGTGNRTLTLTPPSGVTIKYRGTYPGLSLAANTLDYIVIRAVTATLWIVSVTKGFV